MTTARIRRHSTTSLPLEDSFDAIAADLGRYLRARGLSLEFDASSMAVFGDGHSGDTYSIDVIDAGTRRSCVLRTSPRGARIVGPADVGRQGRIMAALGARGLPVPEVIACDSATCVDGRAFVLMERVDGEPWNAATAGYTHRRIAEQAVATLRSIHDVPIAVAGIGDEKPVSLKRELEYWSRLLSRADDSLQRRGLELLAELERSQPRSSSVAFTHGDYHYGNLLFGHGAVVAVLDWEIAEVGAPLLDLGCLAVASLRRTFEPEPNPTGSVDVGVVDLFELYGADPVEGGWYVALSCFKYAAILGFNLQLHRAGKRIDPVYEEFPRTSTGLLDIGAAILHDGIDAVAGAAGVAG